VNPIRYRGYYYDTETGFYYLQSRYYDPAISRFINADSYGSTGQAFLGTNMFAYCNNNPVLGIDPDGHIVMINPDLVWKPVKESAKLAKKALAAAKDALKDKNGTVTVGKGFGFSPAFWLFGVQGMITLDPQGNTAFQVGGSVSLTIGSAGISPNGFISISNAPLASKLEGEGLQIGGSIGTMLEGLPVAFGGDFNVIPDYDENTTYYGGTYSVGLGGDIGLNDLHVGGSYTHTVCQFNIFDAADSFFDAIIGIGD
ncbi:MAG: RHS repeat-associated core domain-containing protein, partial [Oscillospiraceae bacterium]|nr:RHS repeat-associated core domain-containing protein [Oscillospiraceae bacterium]